MYAPAGFQDVFALLAIDNFEAELRPVTRTFGDPVTEPTEVDHDRFDAGQPQVFEMPFEQTLTTDFNQRLWHFVRDRTQAFTPARGKNHCFHNFAFIPGNTRSSISLIRNPSSS